MQLPRYIEAYFINQFKDPSFCPEFQVILKKQFQNVTFTRMYEKRNVSVLYIPKEYQ